MKRPASGTHEAPAIHRPDKRRKYGDGDRLDRLKWLLINTSMSRKQIAVTMKITEFTCRTYNQELFKREAVSARAALMLREIQRLSAENFRLREAISAGPFIQTR